MDIKRAFRLAGNILSSVFLVVSLALCAIVFITNMSCAKTGEEPFYFGYRPCFIQSGSMEPYMMTNGIILTKQVNGLEELKIGDVITYKMTNSDGQKIYITHRITNISNDGVITTKGDNNEVEDAYELTMNNVVAKEVGVYNQPSVFLVGVWESGTVGKVVLTACILSIIFVFYSTSRLFSSRFDNEEIEYRAIEEYSKICRKMGLVPSQVFAEDLQAIRTRYEVLLENKTSQVPEIVSCSVDEEHIADSSENSIN